MINKKHFLGIDALRFFAAVIVMLFHFGFLLGAYPTSSMAAAAGHLAFPELYPVSHFGWVGVEIFFVISGFVIAFSGEKSSPFEFFVSRVARLGPGVWICAPVTLAVLYVAKLPVGESEMRGFRHSMLFMPWAPWIDGTYWTLGIEIAFSALVYCLIKLNRFMSIRYVMIAIGLVSAAYSIPQFADGLAKIMAPRTIEMLLIRHGQFFALGVFLWLGLVKNIRFYFIWCALFCATGCLEIIRKTNEWNDSFATHNAPVLACAIWLISITAICASVRLNHLVHRLPQYVLGAIKSAGMMTFPLYLIHEMVGVAILGVLARQGVNRWASLIIVLCVTLLGSWVIAVFLEPILQRVIKKVLFDGRALSSKFWGVDASRTAGPVVDHSQK